MVSPHRILLFAIFFASVAGTPPRAPPSPRAVAHASGDDEDACSDPNSSELRSSDSAATSPAFPPHSFVLLNPPHISLPPLHSPICPPPPSPFIPVFQRLPHRSRQSLSPRLVLVDGHLPLRQMQPRRVPRRGRPKALQAVPVRPPHTAGPHVPRRVRLRRCHPPLARLQDESLAGLGQTRRTASPPAQSAPGGTSRPLGRRLAPPAPQERSRSVAALLFAAVREWMCLVTPQRTAHAATCRRSTTRTLLGRLRPGGCLVRGGGRGGEGRLMCGQTTTKTMGEMMTPTTTTTTSGAPATMTTMTTGKIKMMETVEGMEAANRRPRNARRDTSGM
jgi:hypothetical protein